MAEPANMHQANLSKLRIERDEDGPSAAGTALKVAGALVLLAALGVGGWVAWDRWLKPVPVVTVARATSPASATGAKSLDASGYLVPQKRAEVATKSAGIVGKVFVEEGDAVKAGDPLAVLVSDSEEAQVKEAAMHVGEEETMQKQAERKVGEAKVREAEARADFERKKKLRETNDIGDAEFDTAKFALEAAEFQRGAAEEGLEWSAKRLETARVQEKLAKIRLEEMTIRAPIDGRVTSRKIHPGEAASPAGITTGTRGGALFTVADFSTLEAEVDVNESRLSELKERHPALLAVDAVPGKRYRGELKQVVPTADRQRAVVKLRVKILDPDVQLLPEMGVRVTFTESAKGSAEPDLPVIPVQAVLRNGSQPGVWIVDGGVVKRRVVELGEERDGNVRVKSGLTGGEMVITGNPVPLSEGMRVKTEER